jgi:hypothetical protein
MQTGRIILKRSKKDYFGQSMTFLFVDISQVFLFRTATYLFLTFWLICFVKLNNYNLLNKIQCSGLES